MSIESLYHDRMGDCNVCVCVCFFIIWVIITVTSRNERLLLPTCHEFPRMQCTDPSKQVKHDSITTSELLQCVLT